MVSPLVVGHLFYVFRFHEKSRKLVDRRLKLFYSSYWKYGRFEFGGPFDHVTFCSTNVVPMTYLPVDWSQGEYQGSEVIGCVMVVIDTYLPVPFSALSIMVHSAGIWRMKMIFSSGPKKGLNLMVMFWVLFWFFDWTKAYQKQALYPRNLEEGLATGNCLFVWLNFVESSAPAGINTSIPSLLHHRGQQKPLPSSSKNCHTSFTTVFDSQMVKSTRLRAPILLKKNGTRFK